MKKHYKAFGYCLLAVGILTLILLLIRPPRSEHQIWTAHYAKEYNLDHALVLAVIKTESNFDPNARSHKDAIGLMQITEETLKWAMMREGKNAVFTAKDLYTPKVNIKYGCLILSLLIEEFQDRDTALAAYNAGRANVLKWLKDSRYSKDGIALYNTPYEETNDYIKKVNRYRLQYQKTLGESE